MIYKKNNNQVTHFIAGMVGEVYCDDYNFHMMTRNERAYLNLIKSVAIFDGNQSQELDSNMRFTLHLSLLGNLPNEYITNKINFLIDAIMSRNLQFTHGNAHEDFTVKDMSIEDLVGLINDLKFQSANNLDTYSIWVVSLQV